MRIAVYIEIEVAMMRVRIGQFSVVMGLAGVLCAPVMASAQVPAPQAPAATATTPAVIPTTSATAPTAPATPAATPAVATPQDPAPVVQAVPAGGGRVFNPDMSVIANFLGVAGKNANNTDPAMSLSEVEVSLQAVVDPYARADFFLSATPGGLSVEEGFITFTALPGDFQMKVGKLRAQFGKVNAQHTHALPYADRPLVSQNLVGGEDGIDDSGISVSRLIPAGGLFLEATGEVFSGTSGVFQSPQRSKLNYVGRLRAYRDITEGSNIDLGASAAFGPTNIGPEANKTLFGIDATFHYRPLRRAIYTKFQARTELIWSRQDAAVSTGVQQKSFGWYALAEYQFARRWYSGVRVDRSARALDMTLTDSGQSAFLTYWPSEFSQIRGQYRRTKYAEGLTGNEVLFQINFSIGAHGAHVF